MTSYSYSPQEQPHQEQHIQPLQQQPPQEHLHQPIEYQSKEEEIWSTSKIIEELHYNLISIKGEEYGLQKYEELAKFLLPRIPVWRIPSESGNGYRPPDFIIELKDIAEEVKKQLASLPKEDKVTIIKQAVSILFENLGPKEKEYFNKNVRHLLRVRFV